MNRAWLTAALVLIAAPAAWGYVFTLCNNEPCYWNDYPVTYYVRDPLGVNLDEEAVLAEIQASFQRWDYEHQTFCSPLKFKYGGRITVDPPAVMDHKNVIFFEAENWKYGAEALAITTCWFVQGQSAFVDCDIAINAVNYDWSIDGENGGLRIRPTLTHEIGHFWGLDHSPNNMATMYAYYNDNHAIAEDLDEDDVRAAAATFCPDEMPQDDAQEQNDSFDLARVLPDPQTDMSDLRLYDDDWWRFDLTAGMRLKVSARDDDPARLKWLELYDETGALADRQRCDGDCAQALGEAGAARPVTLRVTGDFDENHVQSERYSLALEFVTPGQEGELYDDDPEGADDSGDDDNGGCGC